MLGAQRGAAMPTDRGRCANERPRCCTFETVGHQLRSQTQDAGRDVLAIVTYASQAERMLPSHPEHDLGGYIDFGSVLVSH